MTVLQAHSAEDRKKLIQILERSAKPGRKRRNKYNNRVTYVDNKRFDSKAEADHYLVLKDREARGEIKDLELQPKYPLYAHTPDGKKIKVGEYWGDFLYWDEREGKRVLADVKGVETALFRIKKKLCEANHGLEVTLVKSR